MTEENRENGAPPVQSLSSSLQLETTPYRPDSGYGPGGTALLLGLVMGAGLVMGWLASWIGQYFYLILIFPIVIGVVLGFVGGFGIHLGKVRSPLLGGVAGFLGGCMAMTSMQYFDYQRFQGGFDQVEREAILRDKEVLEKLGDAPGNLPGQLPKRAELRKLRELNRLALEALQVTTFFQYVDFSARQGVELGRLGRGEGLNLGYYGTYIYWLVEIWIVAGMAFAIARSAASEPFCRQCQSWKESGKLGAFLNPDAKGVQAAIEGGAIGRLLDYVPAPEGGPLVVSAAVCPNCATDSPVDVKLEHVTKNKKGEETTQQLAHVAYPGEALPAFEALFAPRPQPQDEVQREG